MASSLSALGRGGVGAGTVAGASSGQGSGLPDLSGALGGGKDTGGLGAGLRAALQTESRGLEAEAPVKARSSTNMNADDDARVRRLMAALDPAMAAGFERALKVDPDLSVVLRFRGTVQADGRLGQIQYEATGQYQPAGLARLEAEISQVLSRAQLGPQLRGVIIKGDRQFRR